jgi:mannitol-specific phosphotransferase system IIBC component
MQTDQKRTCPNCNAANDHEAGFCWQCYSPFAPAAPSRGVTSPLVPATPHTLAPAAVATPSRGRGHVFLRIVLGVVVAIVVSTVVRNMLTPTYHVPDSLAGQQRLHTADAQQFEQSMADQGDKYDIESSRRSMDRLISRTCSSCWPTGMPSSPRTRSSTPSSAESNPPA